MVAGAAAPGEVYKPVEVRADFKQHFTLLDRSSAGAAVQFSVLLLYY